MASPIRAEIPDGVPVVRGTLVGISAEMLQIGTASGQQQDALVAPGATIVVARPLPRSELTIGEPLAVNADEVQMPGGRLVMAGIYVQADASVAPADRERLTRLFLPASGSNPEPHVVISGRLASVQGTSITIQNGNGMLPVKLLPEASGLTVRMGQVSDLHKGAIVTAIMSANGAQAILVEQ